MADTDEESEIEETTCSPHSGSQINTLNPILFTQCHGMMAILLHISSTFGIDNIKSISEDVQSCRGGPRDLCEEGEGARFLPGAACSPPWPSPRFTSISGDYHMIMMAGYFRKFYV